MSSHREAPEIWKDPVADSTDVYAFVSPDKPGTVTLIANYIPLQSPAGGPNFYEFGDAGIYESQGGNNGALSTPGYGALAAQAVHQLGGGITVFAGQRAEGFYVDLGAIFDLGDLRPFQNLHLGGMAAAHAVNATHD